MLFLLLKIVAIKSGAEKLVNAVLFVNYLASLPDPSTIKRTINAILFSIPLPVWLVKNLSTSMGGPKSPVIFQFFENKASACNGCVTF